MEYPPNMTSEVRRKLMAEIAAFDEKKTLQEIEENALGGKNVNAYGDWLEENGYESSAANPDKLPDEQSFRWGRASKDADVQAAKKYIKVILTPMQWRVWQACMKHGLTQDQAAFQLHITQQGVAKHLASAQRKVEEYFRRGKE